MTKQGLARGAREMVMGEEENIWNYTFRKVCLGNPFSLSYKAQQPGIQEVPAPPGSAPLPAAGRLE